MHELNFFAPCLWLAVDVGFEKGVVTGSDASELWRAVIKDGLLATRPEQALALLEPMRARGRVSNVDCCGLVIECRDQERGARLFLKFLGRAYDFAPACLLALAHGLGAGIGRQKVVGSLLGIHAWQGGQWHEIAMPLTGAELERWRADPAVLAGFNREVLVSCSATGVQHVLQVLTRTRWLWRHQGKPVTRAPELTDVLTLVAQRVERFDLVWGRAQRSLWVGSLDAVLREASEIKPIEHNWRPVRRKVGGQYPSHGHVGRLVFEGCVSAKLMYWLYAGSFLHVGQQTAIGLGGYGLALEATALIRK